MFTLRLPVLFLSIGIAMMEVPEVRADSLSRLRDISRKSQPSVAEYEEAKNILDGIEQSAKIGEATVLESLFRIIEDDNSHGLICEPILPVLAAKANALYADKLLTLMRSKLDDLAQVQFATKDLKHGRDAALVGRFVESCVENTLKKLRDPKPLLGLLVQYGSLKTGWARPELQQKALRDLATANVDVEIRKDFGFQVLDLMRKYPAPEGFSQLFEEKDFPRLREMIRASNDNPDTFCYGAADVLAHHGDKAALPDLRTFLDRHAVGKPTPEGMIRWNIWQIEQQHPPTNLLDYIRGTDQRAGEQGRIWAMKRAIELKISKQAIRDAILAHADVMKSDGAKHSFSLSSLKKAAIDCRVLNKDDLPGVAIAQSPATP